MLSPSQHGWGSSRGRVAFGTNSESGEEGWMRWRVSIAVLVLALTVFALGPTRPPAQHPWHVVHSGQAGQLTVYGGAPLGARLGLPLAGGDLDGDGKADLVVTPMFADSGTMRQRDSAGEAVVIFSSGSIGGVIDLATLPR